MSTKIIDIYKLAQEYGFGLKRQRKHMVWQHVVSGYIVTTSKTFSDARALRNIESNFKKGSKLPIPNSS